MATIDLDDIGAAAALGLLEDAWTVAQGWAGGTAVVVAQHASGGPVVCVSAEDGPFCPDLVSEVVTEDRWAVGVYASEDARQDGDMPVHLVTIPADLGTLTDAVHALLCVLVGFTPPDVVALATDVLSVAGDADTYADAVRTAHGHRYDAQRGAWWCTTCQTVADYCTAV